VTFKLEQKAFDFDFSNPRQAFGLMNILYPFFSNLASITDAKIKFNELILVEVLYSQQKLQENIINKYWNQGLR
jgi:replication initiation and membrane attachment protein DnaB